MKSFKTIVALLTLKFLHSIVYAEKFISEDIFVPSECDQVASSGDHLLLEYAVTFANGSSGASLKRPSQLYPVILDSSEDYPILKALKGMCRTGIRSITWDDPKDVDLAPIFLPSQQLAELSQGLSIAITVDQITTADDYQIFDNLRQGNTSRVLELIDEHKGVNAVDDWGQTALMTAVQQNKLILVAGLLNTRMPKVDVNIAKPSGFTALYYSIELSSPSIMSALLRRGADPNVSLLQSGSKGNTPLHFACLLEKNQHAELLLQYGAVPDAKNEHGQTPIQLLPRDAVPSVRLSFRKMFEDAFKKIKEAEESEREVPASETRMSGRNEF